MDPTHFPVIVVGTKYDEFGNHESEKLKWMCRALRYICHTNACDLVMSSNKDKGFVEVKAILNSYVFEGSRMPKLQFDHSNALCITRASDKLTKIGDLPGIGTGSMDSTWIREYFPLTQEEKKEMQANEMNTGSEAEAMIGDMSKYEEAKIDSMGEEL